MTLLSARFKDRALFRSISALSVNGFRKGIVVQAWVNLQVLRPERITTSSPHRGPEHGVPKRKPMSIERIVRIPESSVFHSGAHSDAASNAVIISPDSGLIRLDASLSPGIHRKPRVQPSARKITRRQRHQGRRYLLAYARSRSRVCASLFPLSSSYAIIAIDKSLASVRHLRLSFRRLSANCTGSKTSSW